MSDMDILESRIQKLEEKLEAQGTVLWQLGEKVSLLETTVQQLSNNTILRGLSE